VGYGGNGGSHGNSWELLFWGTESPTGQIGLNRYDGSTSTSWNTSGATITAGQWYHVAVSRTGGNLRVFINGVAYYNAANTFNFTQVTYGGNTELWTGLGYYGPAGGLGGPRYLNGYISNIRIINGTGIYSSNFTPSTTPLTAVTNTQLLSAQSNRFVDNSTNAQAITTGGSPTVQRFSPFAPLTVYNPTTYGGSAYFDGSGDYLTSTSPNLTGTWTVEMWWYPLNVTSQQTFISFNSGSYQGINMWCNASGQMIIDDGFNGQSAFTTTTFKANAWNHLAIVRNGTTTTGYINGVVAGSNSFTPSPTNTMMVGRYNSSPFYYVSGYITDIRVTNSTAVYTAAFTPPTAPLTAITNTSLLLNYTNPAILDNAMMNNLETVGNAAVSTSVKKYGAASMYFDGTGDYLTVPSTPNLAFGGNFTVEAWLYLNSYPSTSAAMYVCDFRNGSTSNFGFGVIGSAGVAKPYAFVGSGPVDATGATSLSLNTWYHIAMVRSGSTVTYYLNGVSDATFTTSFSQGATGVTVGARYTGATEYVAGYIDDLRITRGVARYTTTFTVPDQAFPNG
jgi:hypothetical protein